MIWQTFTSVWKMSILTSKASGFLVTVSTLIGKVSSLICKLSNLLGFSIAHRQIASRTRHERDVDDRLICSSREVHRFDPPLDQERC